VICVNDVDEDATSVNEVLLRGRVSGAPQERELPSGSMLVTFRLVVTRGRTPMTAASKPSSDWVECAAWGARVRKQAGGWADGNWVEVRGALRRRYYRAGDQSRSALDVEMLGGRLLRRGQGGGRESVRAATG
jgi:single-strand DNA-binding protein